MNIYYLIYGILGLFFLFALTLLVLVISGKSILYDFKRLILKNGCDVFIANKNRSLSHYFMVPKNDSFKIDKCLYVTNPEKTMNLSPVDKLRVIYSLRKTDKKIKAKCLEIDKKIEYLNQVQEQIKDQDRKRIYLTEIETLKNQKETLLSNNNNKLKNYFNSKRPAYFYVEGDSVPKDFHEYLTEMDGVVIDNLVTRGLTSPPKFDEIKKQTEMLRYLIIGVGIICLIALVFGFKNMSTLMAVCEKLGCA